MKQNIAMAVQCAVSAAIGCAFFWLVQDDPNPKVPLVAGLAGGFGGGWLVMFTYVWVRYGWKAARSMSLTP